LDSYNLACIKNQSVTFAMKFLPMPRYSILILSGLRNVRSTSSYLSLLGEMALF